MDKELLELRSLMHGHQIRIIHLALTIHKEQERIDDYIRIIDAMILKSQTKERI
jgi:hypothetical protein